MNFELCTDSVEGAVLAGKYDFTSIELCSALSLGGLTPNFGLIKECVDHTSAEVHVMIRHKEGGFQVSEEDLELMKLDIHAAKSAGAFGVVFGILNDDNRVSDKNLLLRHFASELGLKTTFHRAFDFVPDFREAIKKVVELGFDRLLTSGLQDTAEKGIAVIKEISRDYGDQIKVVAGSGISASNALNFSMSGIRYLHFTARKAQGAVIDKGMGQLMTTDIQKIEQIVNLPYDYAN